MVIEQECPIPWVPASAAVPCKRNGKRMRERMTIQAHMAAVFMVCPPYAAKGSDVMTETNKKD